MSTSTRCAAVVVIRYSVQDAKTHKRAFTLRTKIALPHRQKSTSASDQYDNDDNLIVNRQYGEQLHLEQFCQAVDGPFVGNGVSRTFADSAIMTDDQAQPTDTAQPYAQL